VLARSTGAAHQLGQVKYRSCACASGVAAGCGTATAKANRTGIAVGCGAAPAAKAGRI